MRLEVKKCNVYSETCSQKLHKVYMVHIYSSCPSSSAHCVCSSMAATLLPSCPWLHVAHTSKVLPVTRSPPLLFPIITCGNKLIANRKGMWAQLLPTRSGHMLEHRVGSTYFSMQNFYPTCKATCVCACLCVCVGKKNIENASSRVAKVFTDVTVNKQRSAWSD